MVHGRDKKKIKKACKPFVIPQSQNHLHGISDDDPSGKCLGIQSQCLHLI